MILKLPSQNSVYLHMKELKRAEYILLFLIVIVGIRIIFDIAPLVYAILNKG